MIYVFDFFSLNLKILYFQIFLLIRILLLSINVNDHGLSKPFKIFSNLKFSAKRLLKKKKDINYFFHLTKINILFLLAKLNTFFLFKKIFFYVLKQFL